jgi:hypothetical protein
MCTSYNGCVGRYAIYYVFRYAIDLMAKSCLESSSTPAYKGA